MIDTDATTCDDVLVAERSLQAPAALPLARRLDGELLAAVRRADPIAVAAALAHGADANAVRRRYRTVFRLGAVADAQDSALLLALKSRRLPAIDVALLLLDHGADPAYENRHGETARSLLGAMQAVVDEAFGEAGRSVTWRLLSARLHGRA